MECGICLLTFDAARQRPKVLPCGHSACLACLGGLREKRCAVCRQEFAGAVKDLPDNFAVISALASSFRRLRLWCIDCKDVAKAVCEARHTLKSVQAALQDEVVRLQVRAALLAEDLPEALRVDDDGASEQALHVLELARQPGTTLDVSVRGQRGEALTATWTNPPAAPAGQQGTAGDVGAEATNVLVLALAQNGLWQQSQRGVKRGREGEEDPEEVQKGAEAAPDLPVMEELKVGGWDLTIARKIQLLDTVGSHRVRRLTNVSCSASRTRTWSLKLLRVAAPHVEQLQACGVRREHLLTVLAMPRLWWLRVAGHSADPSKFPAELPPPPTHHAGLRWLRLSNLPRETTFSLLRAHAGALEELHLVVGTAAGREWPYGCDDLHAALGRCGLARLWRLVLLRIAAHVQDRCLAQLGAVRGALPGVLVQCDICM